MAATRDQLLALSLGGACLLLGQPALAAPLFETPSDLDLSSSIDVSGSMTVNLGRPIVVTLGPHDDVISLAPDRLTVEPIDGDRVRLIGGPRIGQAAVLILRGGETQTVSVQVGSDRVDENGVLTQAASERPYVAYASQASLAGVDGRPAFVTSTHAVQASQELDDAQWWTSATIRSRGDRWLLNAVGLHLQNDRHLLHVGDNTVPLASQQTYLALRGARVETQLSKGLRVGGVGGWWRDGNPSSNFLQVTKGKAAVGYVTARHEQVFAEAHLGGLQTEEGPELTTRGQVGIGMNANRASVEIATLGMSVASSIMGQLTQGPVTLRGRSMWRQAGFSPLLTVMGNRGSHDLTGLVRLDEHWTVSTIGAVSTSSATQELSSSTVAVAGTGLRFAPTKTLFFDSTYRSGMYAQDAEALALNSHAMGLSAQRTSRERIFGRAQGEIEVSTELAPTSGRYAFVAGYGEPALWSTSVYLRGIRYSDKFDERLGLASQMRTDRLEWTADAGLSRFRVDEALPLQSTLRSNSSPYSSSNPWSMSTGYASGSPTSDVDTTTSMGPSAEHEMVRGVGLAPSVGANGAMFVTTGLRFAVGGVRRFPTEHQVGSWRIDSGVSIDGPVIMDGGWSMGLSGSVAGQAYNDRNADGVRDFDEDPIEGLHVELDGLRSTQTDERGHYRFLGVAQGPHTVTLDRADWRSVTGGSRGIDVAWMQRAEIDFPMRPGGHIEGRVFVDRNFDGKYQPGELGVKTDVVELRDSDGEVVDTADVDGGLFSFRGMGAGQYSVHVPMTSLPAGISAQGSGERQVNVRLGRTAKVEFVTEAMRSISGHAWIDTNQSGVYESTDAPASGAWVHLSDGRVTRADVEGRYLFRSLAAGSFRVWLDPALKSRSLRLSRSPTELNRVDVFVTEARLEGVQSPDGLLALGADSQVMHAVAGEWIEDRFFALHNDLQRTSIDQDRSWRLEDSDVVLGDADGLFAVSKGESDVVLTVGEVTARPIHVEVHDRPWSEAEVPSMLQLHLQESASAGTVSGLVASLGRAVIPLGDRSSLNVTAVFTDGTVSRLENEVDWAIAGDGVVTVSPDGWLVGDAVGRTTLVATLGDAVSIPVEVEVVADPVTSLVIGRPRFEVDVGEGRAVPVAAVHRSRRRSDVSGTVRWWTTDPEIAEVGPDGSVVGLRPGTTRLWASIGSMESASVSVLVQPRSIAGLTADVPRELVVGSRAIPHSVGVDVDGRVQPLEQVAWISSNPDVIRVETDGALTAVRRGRSSVRAVAGDAESLPIEVRVLGKRSKPRFSGPDTLASSTPPSGSSIP